MQFKENIRVIHTISTYTLDEATSHQEQRQSLCYKVLEPWIGFAYITISTDFKFGVAKAITSRLGFRPTLRLSS